MKCPACQGKIQGGWRVCPHCGESLRYRCPQCKAEVRLGWKACPVCASALTSSAENPAGAGAHCDLDSSVVKEVRQEGSNGGGASLTARDSVIRSVTQHASGNAPGMLRDSSDSGAEEVGSLASINLGESVVKSVVQNVSVNLVGAEDVAALLDLGAARALRTVRVFVACGPRILAYDPNPDHGRKGPIQEFQLPAHIGGARSVRLAKQGDRLMVLCGAHGGVVAFDAEGADARVYPLPRRTRHAVNASAIRGEHLYATHSDFGLLRWPLEGGEPEALFPEVLEAANTVRGVKASLEGELLVCAGRDAYRIKVREPDARPIPYRGSPGSELIDAVECGEYVFAASLDGRILRWSKSLAGKYEMVLGNLDTKVYSLSLAQMDSGPHLVVGTKSDSVHLIRLVPPQATVRYRTRGARVRWARGASDLIVATDRSCQRLFFWHPRKPHRPAWQTTVSGRGKKHILDLCLLSM